MVQKTKIIGSKKPNYWFKKTQIIGEKLTPWGSGVLVWGLGFCGLFDKLFCWIFIGEINLEVGNANLRGAKGFFGFFIMGLVIRDYNFALSKDRLVQSKFETCSRYFAGSILSFVKISPFSRFLISQFS